jgi:hypothetical protein
MTGNANMKRKKQKEEKDRERRIADEITLKPMEIGITGKKWATGLKFKAMHS